MRRQPARPPRHRLIEIVARQMYRRLGGAVSVDELYDLGVPGLAVAHSEWDGRGRFEPFAMERIRWATLDALRKRRRDALAMAAAATELSAEQHPRTADELCAAGGEVQRAAEDSIDELVDRAGANLAFDVDGAGQVEDDADRIRLRRAITELPPPQDDLMDRYIYRGETFEEIGKALGMCPSAACKIHGRAVAALRRRLGERSHPAGSPRPTL